MHVAVADINFVSFTA